MSNLISMLDYVLENTLDNYEKFVCQYWLQNVLRLKEYPNTPLQINTHTVLKHLHNNQTFLELTPLHLISDEDAIEVSKIWGSKVESKILGNIICIRIGTAAESEVRNSIGVIDFLRSKGYALPYGGLSVDEQVSRGWVVLN